MAKWTNEVAIRASKRTIRKFNTLTIKESKTRKYFLKRKFYKRWNLERNPGRRADAKWMLYNNFPF